MDAVFWAAKRAHHAALKFCRPLLAPYGLTPARFDLLFMLDEKGAVSQMALRSALGVARATISEMLTALESLGLVARDNFLPDRRTRSVALTTKGRELVDAAYYTHISGGIVSLAVDCAFGAGNPLAEVIFSLKDWFDGASVLLRAAFRDSADHDLYRWHPDD